MEQATVHRARRRTLIGTLIWAVGVFAMLAVVGVLVAAWPEPEPERVVDPRSDPARCPPIGEERVLVRVVEGPLGDECLYFDLDSGRSLNPSDPVLARPVE